MSLSFPVSSLLLSVISAFFLQSVHTSAYYEYDRQVYPSSPNNIFGIFRFPSAYEDSSEDIVSHNIRGIDYDQESSQDQEQMLPRSTSLCPEEQERYDPITHTCHTPGTTGPCGRYMIFTGNEYLNPDDSVFGHCECDNSRYDRPLVSTVQGQCHFLYTQAMCGRGYWLAISKNLGPVCKPNPCASKLKKPNGRDMDNNNSFVYFHGECVKLYTPSKFCPRKNDVVMFSKGSSSLEPICGSTKSRGRRIFRRQITKTIALPCGPCPSGQIRLYSSSCKCRRVLAASAFA